MIHEEFFEYQRESSVEDLVDLALKRHYSTFSLYDEEEFESSIQKFCEKLEKKYDKSNKIT
ncbi:MAG: hypothetical protein GTN99_00280, partial [Candidatus Dadabacteria bacterium]|nr:hypothetical protein [Candidatus Dadabacteria bacterium]